LLTTTCIEKQCTRPLTQLACCFHYSFEMIVLRIFVGEQMFLGMQDFDFA